MATDLPEPTDSGSRGQAVGHDCQAASRKGQPWTEEEHVAFLDGLKKLGRGQWRLISRHFVKTRTPTQVASHAQKHFIRLSGLTKRKSRFTSLESTLEQLGDAAEAAAAAGPSGDGRASAVPGHSSGSSDQQQRHQGSADATTHERHAPSSQAAAAATAAAQFPLAAMGPYGAALMQLGMHPAMMQQAMMFAALAGGVPFMPPFMCPPPALAAAAAMNAAAMQKQGAAMLSMFPMSAFQAGMPAMWAQAAVALAQQQYMGLVAQEAQEQEAAGTGMEEDDDNDEVEQQQRRPEEWQEAKPQPRHHQQQQQHRPQPQRRLQQHAAAASPPPASPPGSPAQVCKPEATHARRSTPEEPSALLGMLPATGPGDVQVHAFHASSHSAFRPPQEVRAES